MWLEKNGRGGEGWGRSEFRDGGEYRSCRPSYGYGLTLSEMDAGWLLECTMDGQRQKRRNQLGSYAATEIDTSSLDKGNNQDDGKKWSNSGYILDDRAYKIFQ